MGIKKRILFFISVFMIVFSALLTASEEITPHAKEPAIDQVIMEEIADNTAHPFFTIPINIGGFSYTFKVTKHVILLVLVVILCVSSMKYLAYKLKTPFKRPTYLQSIFEIIIEYLDKNVLGVTLGDEGRKYLPFCLTMFFFILYSNLVGLIPPFWHIPSEDKSMMVYLSGAATANLSVTGALAAVAFIAYNVAGMKKKGVIKYWTSLVPHGVPIVLSPIIWVIEFIGLFTRAFSLAIRLFANMIGGHIMVIVIPFLIIIFGSIFVAPFAIAFLMFIYLLEMLVAVIQAYVFSFLTAVFISLSIEEH